MGWWRSPAFRLILSVSILLAAIVIPFALWGSAIETWSATTFSSHQQVSAGVITLGLFLLVLDTWLPVPSSLVAVFLCLQLGPITGGALVALGSLASFATGYVTGWFLPESRVRAWVGESLWSYTASAASSNAFWWIYIARPLPVLAEASAVCAGVWRVAPGAAFTHAAVSSVVLGSLYGVATHIGERAPSLAVLAASMALLPVLFWVIHRFLLRGARV
jgi:hypothetical protein